MLSSQHIPLLLIVEDNAEMLEMLSEALMLNALHIIQAENGAHALDILTTADILPDLIITDWLMPVMDGVNLIHQIRNNPRWSHIPILVITGGGEDFAKLKLKGIQGVFTKPFEVEELYATIIAMLNDNKP